MISASLVSFKKYKNNNIKKNNTISIHQCREKTFPAKLHQDIEKDNKRWNRTVSRINLGQVPQVCISIFIHFSIRVPSIDERDITEIKSETIPFDRGTMIIIHKKQKWKFVTFIVRSGLLKLFQWRLLIGSKQFHRWNYQKR